MADTKRTIKVSSCEMPKVQEIQIMLGHIIFAIVEKELFPRWF